MEIDEDLVTLKSSDSLPQFLHTLDQSEGAQHRDVSTSLANDNRQPRVSPLLQRG